MFGWLKKIKELIHLLELKNQGCKKKKAVSGEFILEWIGSGSEAYITRRVYYNDDTTEDAYKVRGSGTVWHYHPSGIRCGTHLERRFVNVWQKEKWKIDDAK